MSKLKPCPFCGSDIQDYPPTFYDEKFPRKSVLGYYVICAACGAQLTQINKFKNVGINWNTRSIEDALLARAEKAEAMVERMISLISYVIDDMPAYNADEWQVLVAEWERRND